ncbi:serine aminopeptidase domain-containing protein [Nocardioides nitrophenolicus]|uniref:serine aminopeptidase domain-containing protein n=1 Tax=Nocardioides nitrophenolicus TaxID=60489 RepID=UPI001959F14A|nr:alpha/beta hydrolase [Nocardioides nitrophenolicus]MBM7515710.1 putative alpha/beta hydrolase [Nocardioides nitrophenolicus]
MSPRSTPIVLVSPAMAIGSGYYRPLVAEIERRGWQARALPRRGFERGEPRASRREDWSYRDEIDEIAFAVAAARAESPERPVLLLGHSLGGQLVAGHELTRPPADGVITVGGAIPHYRHFRYGGLHLAAMAALVVPVMTALLGYLPKPAFGGPGARTLMREWARMVLTGRPPYAIDRPITTPALVVSLGDDALSPLGAVDALADRLFAPAAVTRWHHTADQLPPGTSNDHIGWVRTPATVVDRIVTWWHDTAPSS